MSRRGSGLPIVWLRTALLIALLAFAAAIVGLYLLGRTGPPEAETDAEAGGEGADQALLSSEGFDYEVTEEGRTVFRVHGDRMISDREDKVVLSGVVVTFFREGGGRYTICSPRGSYNPQTNETDLSSLEEGEGPVSAAGAAAVGCTEGEDLVQLYGPNGLVVKTRGLRFELPTRLMDDDELAAEEGAEGGAEPAPSRVAPRRRRPVRAAPQAAKGRAPTPGRNLQASRLRTTAPVVFRLGQRFAGRADRLQLALKSRVYRLDQRVEIDALAGDGPGASLRCDHLLLERDSGLVRALGNVELTQGGRRLEARRLAAYLSDDERHVRFIRAQFGVSGAVESTSVTGLPQTLALRGASLSVLFDEQGDTVRQAEVEGDDERPAILDSVDGTGLTRRMSAPYLLATFAAGDLSRVDASGPVRLAELLPFAGDDTLRSACARSATADFAKGVMRRVHLEHEVDLVQPDLFAVGDLADFELASGAARLEGTPVRVRTSRGDLEAPRVSQARQGDEIRADGGVRAMLHESSAAALGGRGPVRVEAAEALWRARPEAVLFRGLVRAWQGEDLLLADELEERPADEQLLARGSVRSLWHPRPEAGKQSPPANAAPLEVSADRLAFTRPTHLLTYSGEVWARQSSRSLRCADMDLKSTVDGKIDTITCRGQVRINDRETGRAVDGDLAVYTPGRDEVRVSGKRVTLRDRDGTVIEGPEVIYDFATGAARVVGIAPEPVVVPEGDVEP